MEGTKTKNKYRGAFACIDSDYLQMGLTKLEYFTAMAMQGYLSSSFTEKEYVAENSVELAKKVLKNLENETNGQK